MKIGDYVRTRKGIDKIINYVGKQLGDNVYEVTQNGTFMPDDCFKYFIFESDIIKSSSNIIDLIEVGDMVKVEDFTFFSYRDSSLLITLCVIKIFLNISRRI